MNRLPVLSLLLLSAACRIEPVPSGKGDTTGTTGDVLAGDDDGDGYVGADDCDEEDGDRHAGATELCNGIDDDCDGEVDEGLAATWYTDADGDGFGDAAASVEACDAPEGAVANSDDCDDTDETVSPDAEEICDERDNNCDGVVDEGVSTEFFEDEDGDGYGNADASISACEAPDGYVSAEWATDCDDDEALSYPGNTEVCDELDNNCDGEVDEGLGSTWYLDQDADQWGDPATTVEACTQPLGYVAQAGDCDDDARAVNPDATEVCNSIDDDCDTDIDDDDASVDPSVGGGTWYTDADTDTYGDAGAAVSACTQPVGTVADDSDCDDGERAVNPGATEVCNSIDDDCDGDIDDDDRSVDASVGGGTWYTDADTDTYGDADSPVVACAQPSGAVLDDTDCDDAARTVNPGATEVCNTVDDDCDGDIDDDDASVDTSVGGGTWYIDGDADRYGDPLSPVSACVQPSGAVADDTDCDDSARAVNPGATEVCNSIDDDCDGDVDDDDASLLTATATTWYADLDTDGYGDAGNTQLACAAPALHTADDTDCDDGAISVNPGASEVCNSIDDDCDGDIDDADASLDTSTATTWYADLDTDGYGDASNSLRACDQPSLYETDNTDCDDGDRTISPGATEVWYDGIDQDCDEADDYDADGDGDPSKSYGGTDCDDTDSSVYGGTGCRPVASCTHPDASTLETYDPSGIVDIVFDDDCNAWLPTLISGTDYVYELDASGNTTVYTGTSNHDIGSIALDPSSSGFAVGYNNVNYVGYTTSSTIPVILTSSNITGSAWSNSYLNSSPSSIAFDSTGCIWVPNLSARGTLSCVETDGSSTVVLTASSYIESVGLDSSENLYVSVGDTIYSVDQSAGTLTAEFVASGTVLDFVFDYNDDLYVESNVGEIELAPADGSGSSTFATVSGQAKLAISPDGYLVRVIPNPVSPASYEEFPLPGAQ